MIVLRKPTGATGYLEHNDPVWSQTRGIVAQFHRVSRTAGKDFPEPRKARSKAGDLSILGRKVRRTPTASEFRLSDKRGSRKSQQRTFRHRLLPSRALHFCARAPDGELFRQDCLEGPFTYRENVTPLQIKAELLDFCIADPAESLGDGGWRLPEHVVEALREFLNVSC